MLITPVALTPRTPIARPTRATGPASPTDTVEIAPAGSRSWLWTSLRASGQLTARLVDNGLGASIEQAQRQALEEVIRQSQERGYRFCVDPSFLQSLMNGNRSVELESHEVLDRVAKGVDISAPGQDLTFRLRNLDVLASLDVLELGQANPEDTAHPREARGLKHLSQAGYKFSHGLVRSYDDQVSGAYSWVSPPTGQSRTMRADEVAAEDFFRVSGDPGSVSDPDFARALGQAAGKLGQDACQLYALAHKGEATLSKHGVELGRITEPTLESLEQALADYRQRGPLLETHFRPLLQGHRLSLSQAGKVLGLVTRPDTGLAPDQASAALARLGRRHPLADASDCFESLVESGRRGQDLVDRLDLTARVADGVGWVEAEETLKFLENPPTREGVWALPFDERLGHLVALSRLSSPRESREFLEEELSRPGPFSARMELLLALLVTAQLDNKSDVATPLRALEEAAPDLPAALATYRQAFQTCLGRGEVELSATTAVAMLRGWSAEEASRAADHLRELGADPRENLLSLFAGAGEGETLDQVSQRFAALYHSLDQLSEARQARQVFPRLAGRDEQFQALLSYLDGVDQVGEASRLFLALDEQSGDHFSEAFARFMTACLAGQDLEAALAATQSLSSSSVDEDEAQVRVGGVVVRKRRQDHLRAG